MSKLSLNTNEFVKTAFYAMPAFTDAEGFFLNGVYGAVYKLLNLLKSGEYSEIELIRSEDESCAAENVNPYVHDQVVYFEKLLSASGEKKVSVNEELMKCLELELGKLSPSGSAIKASSFECSIKVTSDLNEVEAIFNTKADFASFYFLMDNISSDGTRKKDVVGLSVCFDGKEVFYIPVENFITADYLGKKLSALSGTCTLATFDIKSSFYYFEPVQISERTYGYISEENSEEEKRAAGKMFYDTLIGAYLVNPLKNDYQIEDIAKEYLDLRLEKKGDIFGKDSLKNSDEKKLSEYAGRVAEVIYRVFPLINKKLQKLGMDKLYTDIEMPLSYILFAMEKEGITAKREELKAYGDKLLIRIEELEKNIYEAAGCEFNINSPKQLGEILFEKLGLTAEKKTKSGYSTAAEVLEKLAPEHKIVADILEYRGLAKLKSTYADGLAAYIEADDRIHTSFNQTITATGRISSTEPNLQNIPMRTELGRLIRKVFVPKEGCVFANADYSQVELRILAHMSGDKGLIKAFNDGEDIHTTTASKVFHVPFEEVTPLQRRSAKAVNFGIVYGISAFGLSQDLSISAGEAKDYMDKYFETYPGVKDYQEKVIASAKAKGYSETMYGRRRPIPELKNGNFNLRQFGERVAMNAPIQGSAADIMKIAMINVFFKLKEKGLKSKLILQIHDELVIETYKDEITQVTDLLTQEMEKAASLQVSLKADCHTGSDWYEAK